LGIKLFYLAAVLKPVLNSNEIKKNIKLLNISILSLYGEVFLDDTMMNWEVQDSKYKIY
jgi:hypothetical protein